MYINRGVAYSALSEYDKAIQIKSNFAKAYYNRGLVYYEIGYYDEAITDFDQAIELIPELFSKPLKTPSPDSPYYRYKMREKYSKPIQFEVDLPLIYTSRGLAYLNKLNNEKALADFDKAIQLEPYLSIAYFYRGNTYLSQMKYDEAVSDLLMVLELKNDTTTQQLAEALLNELGVK